MRKIGFLLVAGFVFLRAFAPSAATANDLNDQAAKQEVDRAALVFELDAETIAKVGSMEKVTIQVPSMGSVNLGDLKSVYGAASIPTDLQSFKNIASTKIAPLDLFVQLQFQSVEFTDDAFAKIKKDCQPAKPHGHSTVDGDQFFRVPTDKNDRLPTNLLVHRFAPDVIEFGTAGYLTSPDRELLSANLAEMWNKTPSSAIRIAFDMDRARPLFEEHLRSKPASPVVHPATILIHDASSLGLQCNFAAKESVLTMTVSGSNEESADRVHKTLRAMGEQHVKSEEAKISPAFRKIGYGNIPKFDSSLSGKDVTIKITTSQNLPFSIGSTFNRQVPAK